ncbi:MAG: hypothetical protein ACI825_000694 [Planctomycetota bacterium]|jgi:hypothetical protein
MKNKLDLVQMDLSEKYKTIKDTFLNNTLYNLSGNIDDIFFKLLEDEKALFLKWLELEFIAKRLLISQGQLLGIHRHADPTEAYAGINEQKQKIDYLQDWIKEKKANTNIPDFEEIDLSNTTGVEKMIYLHKLGVIDFLIKKQPFNASINSLAVALSAVTGEKTTTLQPYLNAMLNNKGTAQKNNPLNKGKAVARVEKQLIKIGFNLDETN